MSKPVIKVEELSKRFIISHEGAERYKALRDVIAQKAKRMVKSPVPAPAREEFYALKDVGFEIHQGDRVGIIGRNGAGKSTLLKLLSRITEPTSGRITIRGRVASLLEVGTGFHPELSGRENIFLNGAILGMSRFEIRKKFDEIVEFAEVEKFLDTPVKRYSSGMYVRLAFAVAANLEPEILIVDEVLAVGDAQFQKKCLGKMEDVSKNQGRTVLFVSHQMDAIESLTSRCIYLKNGTVFSEGETRKTVDLYLNNYNSEDSIATYRDRFGNGKARIVKLEIKKEENTVLGVKQGEAFKILLGIEVNEPIKLDMSIAVENQRQQPLFCTQLSDLQGAIQKDKYFEVLIDVSDPKIRKGDYMISIATYKPDQTEFYDVVHHFPLLSIEGIAETSDIPVDNRLGNLYFPIKWSEIG